MALHYLTSESSEHGGLRITPQGLAFLRQKEPLPLRKFVARAKAPSASRTRSESGFRAKADLPALEGSDRTLFEALRAARLELARAQNIAPYIIFHDRTLREMVQHRPVTLFAFSNISGVGQKKTEHYGPAFVEVISRHNKE